MVDLFSKGKTVLCAVRDVWSVVKVQTDRCGGVNKFLRRYLWGKPGGRTGKVTQRALSKFYVLFLKLGGGPMSLCYTIMYSFACLKYFINIFKKELLRSQKSMAFRSHHS